MQLGLPGHSGFQREPLYGRVYLEKIAVFHVKYSEAGTNAGKTGKPKHACSNLYELTFFLVFSSFSSCDPCLFSARVVWTARPGYRRPSYLPLGLEFPLPAPLHPRFAYFHSGYGRHPFPSAFQGQVYDALIPFPDQFYINFHPHPAPSVGNRLPRIRYLPRPIPG